MRTDETIEPFLHRLCDAAADHTMRWFRGSVAITNKQSEGFDPVTRADKDAETAIRALIAAEYPDHGIHGEEEGLHNPAAALRWVIDPVDGTRAFITGLPVWGTLIGLTRDGTPVAGIMHQPFTGERFVGHEDGAFLVRDFGQGDGSARTRMATRDTPTLAQATIATTTPALFSNEERARYDELEAACRLARYGLDCYGYAMVAAGHADLVVESGLQAYDIVALIPVIERAGGVVSDWSGGPAAQGGKIIAAANAQLHAQALEFLAG